MASLTYGTDQLIEMRNDATIEMDFDHVTEIDAELKNRNVYVYEGLDGYKASKVIAENKGATFQIHTYFPEIESSQLACKLCNAIVNAHVDGRVFTCGHETITVNVEYFDLVVYWVQS